MLRMNLDDLDAVAMSKPGVYALDCHVPVDVGFRWDEVYRTRPDWFVHAVCADELVYVGLSTNVHRRLREHADGRKRVAKLLRVFPPAGLYDWRALELTNEERKDWNRLEVYERDFARELAGDGTVCLCNGELIS